MTPKEKAISLVDRFDDIYVLGEEHNGYTAQQCALVAVDEVLSFIDNQMQGWLDADWVAYWNEVKEEINKL